MPMRDTPTRETLWALKNATPQHTLLTEVGLPVDEARNALAKRILEYDSEEFVAWIDDDACWMPGSIEELVSNLTALPDCSLVCGSFSERRPYGNAIAGGFGRVLQPGPPGQAGCNVFFGQVVPIEHCGFHFLVMRTAALRTLGPKPFDTLGLRGEDYSFCHRLVSQGGKLACNPAVAAAHIEVKNGLAFLPGHPPFKIEGGRARALKPQDVGALQGVAPVGRVKNPDGTRALRIEMKTQQVRSYGTAVDAAKLLAEKANAA